MDRILCWDYTSGVSWFPYRPRISILIKCIFATRLRFVPVIDQGILYLSIHKSKSIILTTSTYKDNEAINGTVFFFFFSFFVRRELNGDVKILFSLAGTGGGCRPGGGGCANNVALLDPPEVVQARYQWFDRLEVELDAPTVV